MLFVIGVLCCWHHQNQQTYILLVCAWYRQVCYVTDDPHSQSESRHSQKLSARNKQQRLRLHRQHKKRPNVSFYNYSSSILRMHNVDVVFGHAVYCCSVSNDLLSLVFEMLCFLWPVHPSYYRLTVHYRNHHVQQPKHRLKTSAILDVWQYNNFIALKSPHCSTLMHLRVGIYQFFVQLIIKFVN